MPNLKLIKAVINYLKEELEKPDANSDTKESLEVAVLCLQTAFDIDPNHLPDEKALPFSLEDIFECASLSIENDESNAEKLKKAEMMKNLGNQLMKTNQFPDAIKYYSAAIDLDKTNAIYYGNRAAAYSKLNDFQNAIRDCEKAIEIDPKYAKAYGRMGLAYASVERYDQAINAFRVAVELDPTNESYQSNLKIAIEKKDKPENLGLNTVDWQTLFTNPAFRNMAQTIMQDANIINTLSSSMTSSLNQLGVTGNNDGSGGSGSGSTSGEPAPNLGTSNLDMLLEAGQYLASQMQAANPDLVEQFRQTASRSLNRPNPDNSDSSTQ